MTIEQKDIGPSLGFSIKTVVGYEFRVPSFYSSKFLRIFHCLCTQVSIGAIWIKDINSGFLFVFIKIVYLFQFFIMSSFVNIK